MRTFNIIFAALFKMAFAVAIIYLMAVLLLA